MSSSLVKSLSRLSRDSLIDICLKWTQESTPYLTTNRKAVESDEEDYLHEPAENIEELKDLYESIKHTQSSSKQQLSKRDIIDRIVDGDWRRGLSLYQYASIDFAYLEQCDTALRWSALKLVPQQDKTVHCANTSKKRKRSPPTASNLHYPTIMPATFLANLKSQISPLVKAHYSIHRIASASSLAVIRLYIVPNAAFAPTQSSIPMSPKQATDAARVMYIALPDSCPYVYVSLSGSVGTNTLSDPKAVMKTKVDMTATKRIVLEAIPKALSKPQERWSLESTKLTTRSLKSICLLRGNSRPGTAGGAYSTFSEEHPSKIGAEDDNRLKSNSKSVPEHAEAALKSHHKTPLNIQLPTPPPEDISMHQRRVHTRFGNVSGSSHASLNRFNVQIKNVLALPPHKVSRAKTRICQQQTSKTQNKGRKRKRPSLEEIENGTQVEDGNIQDGGDDDDDSHSTNKDMDQPASISITIQGSDVFAGLKKLASLGEQFVDLDKMPAWLTGEKGVTSLTI